MRPAGEGGHLSGGHGVPSVRTRGGVSVMRLIADTEGPRPGPHFWVVAGGVSARRERGQASAERPLTRRAKNPTKSKKECQPSQRRKKRAWRLTGSVRVVISAIWVALIGVNARASCTSSSTCATVSQPTITVLTGSEST
jgi:hypothetical protein